MYASPTREGAFQGAPAKQTWLGQSATQKIKSPKARRGNAPHLCYIHETTMRAAAVGTCLSHTHTRDGTKASWFPPKFLSG